MHTLWYYSLHPKIILYLTWGSYSTFGGLNPKLTDMKTTRILIWKRQSCMRRVRVAVGLIITGSQTIIDTKTPLLNFPYITTKILKFIKSILTHLRWIVLMFVYKKEDHTYRCLDLKRRRNIRTFCINLDNRNLNFHKHG